MKATIASLFFLPLLFSIGFEADASLVNGGFESGLSGWESTFDPFPAPPDYMYFPAPGSGGPAWTGSDSASIGFSESYFPASPGFSAVDGSRFLIMQTNGFGEYFHWYYDENDPWKITGPGGYVYTTVRQTVHLKANDRVSGWAASVSEETMGSDSARVAIQRESGELVSVPWFAFCGGPFGGPGQRNEAGQPLAEYTPWTHWQWTAPYEGNYTIALQTGQDCEQYQTYGLFDDIRVETVPEPGSFLLLGSGLIGLIVYGKKI